MYQVLTFFPLLKVLSYWNLNVRNDRVEIKSEVLKYYHIGI